MTRGASAFLSLLFALAACGDGSSSHGSATTLQETGSMGESASPEWWLNSGGEVSISGGSGGTIRGALPADSPWHERYAASNPRDTDGGSHPQNLLRLIRRQVLHDPHQQMEFDIEQLNASASPNRNESNGVLFLSRYLSGDDLYYAGVRVDGAAVVKRKLHGQYSTLGYRQIFPGPYDRQRSPNLIPQGGWIAMSSDVVTNSDGSVTIRLSVGGSPVLEVVDRGAGGSPIRDPGFVGIRSDFMDLMFRGYQASELSP